MVPLGGKARRPLVTTKAPSRTAQRPSFPKKAVKSKKPKVAKATSASSDDNGGGGTTRKRLCDDGSENESAARLREQLLHVLVDHQRQEEEIVALRALAKSLKEEVEQIQKHRLHADAVHQMNKVRPHEYFKLDLQLERLRGENARLHGELGDATRELERIRNVANHEIPQYKIAAVQARAELECVKSQLADEQAYCDRLRAQVAYFRARSDAPIRVSKPLQPRRGTTAIHSGMNKPWQKGPRTHPGEAEQEARDRERKAFLLQCCMNAVHDKENHSASGNDARGDVELRMRRSPFKGSELGSSSSSGSCRLSSRPSSRRAEHPSGSSSSAADDSCSAQVHRDLTGLDHELQELHLSLQKLPTDTKGGL